MNLARAEVQRLLARRFVQVLLALVLGAFLVTFATTALSTHPPGTQELARAEQQLAVNRAQAEANQRECLERYRSPSDPGRVPPECQYFESQRFEIEDFLPGVFVFSRQIRDLLYFLAAFLGLFGFLAGASYVGAELTSGGMTNLLLWRPQRNVVLLTKLGVLLGGVAITAAAATLLYIATFWGLAEVAGLPGELTGSFWGSLSLVGVRGTLLALLAAALGFAVATIGRHTAAALGAIAAYAVVWEAGARIVMNITQVPRPDAWMLSAYLAAWMSGDVQLYDYRPLCSADGGSCEYHVTLWHALAVFAVLLVVFVGGALADFRRRDLA